MSRMLESVRVRRRAPADVNDVLGAVTRSRHKRSTLIADEGPTS